VKKVIVESPFAGRGDARIVDAAYKKAYLAACLHDCYMRGESPIASHAIGPLALDDDDPAERERSMKAISPWREAADMTAVYEDLGVVGGMKWGVQEAERLATQGHELEFRKLGPPWSTP
jgi:hypothetical protein